MMVDDGDENKRKACTQLTSELKKRCPSMEKVANVVSLTLEANADINEPLPKLSSPQAARGDGKDTTPQEFISSNFGGGGSSDEDGRTDAAGSSSADDCDCESVNSGCDRSASVAAEEEAMDHSLPLNPIQQAAYIGHRPTIKVLLKHNPDISRKVETPGFEFSNMSAIEIAEQRGHHRSARLLNDYAVYRKKSTSMDAETEDELNSKSGYNSGDLSMGDMASHSPNSSRSGSPSPFMERYRSRAGSDVSMLESDVSVGVGSADGYKRPTEDRVVVFNMHDIQKVELYCVFDGHGGRHYADFVAKQLPPRIHAGIKRLVSDRVASGNGNDVPTAEEYAEVLKESFEETDSKLVAHSARMSLLKVGGTTAVATLVTPTHIITANVGDSPCVVFDATSGSLLRQTTDHIPANEEEAQRVRNAGGKLVVGKESGELRILTQTGHLGVTRAFGQVSFKDGKEKKQHVVSASPDIYIWPREEIRTEMECKFEDWRNKQSSKVQQAHEAEAEAGEDGRGERTQPPQNMMNAATTTAALSSFEVQRRENNFMSTTDQRPRLFLAMYSDSFTEALCDHPEGLVDKETGRPTQIITNCLSNQTVLVLFRDVLKSNNYNCAVSAEQLAIKQQNKFQFNGSFHGDNTSLILVDVDNL
jgi:serine/threonine protein phosphatase PrpC